MADSNLQPLLRGSWTMVKSGLKEPVGMWRVFALAVPERDTAGAAKQKPSEIGTRPLPNAKALRCRAKFAYLAALRRVSQF